MPTRTSERRSRGVAVTVCVIAAAAVSGCAGARAATLEPRPPPAAAPTGPSDSLSAFIAKVRTLTAEASAARPVRAPSTLEDSDAELSSALLAAIAAPAPSSYRDVAAAYARRGIVDAAHEYLNKARQMDPADGSTYEALARLWRDWGPPHLALGDAHRAVHYAPAWAVAHNTLGTILLAIGRREGARDAFERALELDSTAAYALNNLCYGWILDGKTRKAIAACTRALEIAPGLRAARNNLGLAHGASNDIAAARRAFEDARDPAAGYYNLGLVHLGRGEYRSAVEAFEAAQTLRPAFARAAARARQARDMVSGGSNQ